MRSAYQSNVNNLEELLDLCSTIQEEILFTEANSRLDYFKNGIQFDKSINIKKRKRKE